jgi:hypothetical protein
MKMMGCENMDIQTGMRMSVRMGVQSGVRGSPRSPRPRRTRGANTRYADRYG